MGIIVNALAVLLGGLLGLFFSEGISQKIGNSIMKGIALIVLVMGIDGALGGENTIIQVVSLVIGVIIGEWLDIDRFVHSIIDSIEEKFTKSSSETSSGISFSKGFITASMIACVGSLAIIGPLELGLIGSNATLYTKSIIDGITSVILASSLGYGVLFAAIPVLIYQGVIALFAGFLEAFLAQAVINEMIAVGSILLIGLGLNILELTNFKLLNYTPAIILPAIIMAFI